MYNEDGSNCEGCAAEIEEDLLAGFLATNGSIKVNSDVTVDNEQLANVISGIIEQKLRGEIHNRVKVLVEKKAEEVVKNAYKDQLSDHIKQSVDRLIEKKFNERFPDAIPEKIEEILEHLKKYKFDAKTLGKKDQWGRIMPSGAVHEQIVELFKRHLDDEFKEIVTKTKKGIDEYAQNYFSRNLFKAMNLMSEVSEAKNLLGEKS